MWRLRVPLTGAGLAGPGVTTFYALDTSPGFPAAVHSLLAAFAGSMPNNVSWDVPNGGDVIDPATGEIGETWTDGTVPARITGSGSGPFSMGVGGQVRWRTSGVVGRRRVVGSTFIVPLSGGAYQADGTLLDTVVSAWNTACANYVTAAPYALVWSRPKAAQPLHVPPLPARAGTTHLIGSGYAPDRVSWLRSRRT